MLANARNDLIEFGMKQRLAAADGDHRGTKRSQLVHALKNGFGGNRLGKVIEFVAVFAGQIAAPDGNDVGQQGMVGRGQRVRDHPRSPEVAVERLQSAAHRRS